MARVKKVKLSVNKSDGTLSVIEEEVNNIAREINRQVKSDLSTGSCVYKLYYGDRYMILKGKTLAGSIFLIAKGLAYHILGGQGTGNGVYEPVGPGRKKNQGANDFNWKFYSFIKNNPGLVWRLEMILASENGYQLLKAEQKALTACSSDPNLMNSSTAAYIPKYRRANPEKGIEAGYGWISRAHVLAYWRYAHKLLPA